MAKWKGPPVPVLAAIGAFVLAAGCDDAEDEVPRGTVRGAVTDSVTTAPLDVSLQPQSPVAIALSPEGVRSPEDQVTAAFHAPAEWSLQTVEWTNASLEGVGATAARGQAGNDIDSMTWPW